MTPPNRIDQLLNGPQPGPSVPPGGGGGPSPSTPTMRPALPTSPFGNNVPVTAAGGGVEFDAGAIEAFGPKLITKVGTELTAARKHINASPRQVEASCFTTFCAALAHAYVQATEYVDVDLVTKQRVLTDVDGKLKETAKILREAERRSTVK
ncbi:hypothetical protein [Thermomonospora cellulosilytica]|uniref:Uncharacterized protein n=1 Tax=Thermomonospora cellulosilytica TaxID=1411118 RepID=A0A7W3MW12_9ACTN|nr:hypothetical protein [Thermomonospora cellulosilytica]MBA9002921.1 hypothetical protein [Thermomonospora cellulosilytica]